MAAAPSRRPRFFDSSADFRAWLERHHATAAELRVGFHKKSSAKKGIGYPEALDEALCFGWIDGVRRSIDDTCYTIRFTPRKPKSNWSLVNIKRVGELTTAGRMAAAGLEAFERRDEYRRTTSYWVMSATKEETRGRRLAALISCCAKGERVPVLG